MPRIPKATLVAVILIGLLTLNAGQANASHVQCGALITEDTTLDSDLLNCPSDGLVIGASNITLDLGGHTVDGDNSEGSYKDGIDNTGGYDDVTVRNGAVKEFDSTEITLLGTTNNRLEALTVSGGVLLDGFSYLDSSSNRIQGNHFLRGAISMIASNRNIIAGNTFESSGVSLFASHLNQIERNIGPSFSFQESDQNRLTKNEILGGLWMINSSDDNLLERNLVSGHISIGGSYRGEQSGSKRNSVVDNKMGDCYGGFFIVGLGDGIFVQGPTDNPYYPSPGAVDTLVSGNLVTGCGNDGIDVRDPTSTITGNTANDNGRFGIRAVPGVTDGGGNRASGNGNSIQCLNVSCSRRGSNSPES